MLLNKIAQSVLTYLLNPIPHPVIEVLHKIIQNASKTDIIF